MKTLIEWANISSPVLFRGDATNAYRDPAVIYHEGVFHLFFTYVKTHPDGNVFLHLAKSQSCDLRGWSEPHILTPSNSALNFSSPGNMVRHAGKWIICLQTYPRPNGEKYADETARLWTMDSDDLEHWSEPCLLRVKGPDVSREAMGRMIDPYLLRDREDPDKWWCFYKQNGVSMSWSNDLKNWTWFAHIDGGENACVVVEDEEYVLFHSPKNGIGTKRSSDLLHWKDEGVFYLGQKDWPWARGRITAGFVLDLRLESSIGKCLLFFHGSGPEDEETMFDNYASMGLAWSETLSDWQFPSA